MIRVLLLIGSLSVAGLLTISNTTMMTLYAYTAHADVMVGALIGGVFVLGFAAGASFLSLFKHGTSPASKSLASRPSFAYKNPYDPKGRAPASTSREIQYE
jgi:hypothetical protein